MSAQNLLFVDVATTGLDPAEGHAALELAWRPARWEPSKKQLSLGPPAKVLFPGSLLALCAPQVRRAHETTGLARELASVTSWPLTQLDTFAGALASAQILISENPEFDTRWLDLPWRIPRQIDLTVIRRLQGCPLAADRLPIRAAADVERQIAFFQDWQKSV